MGRSGTRLAVVAHVSGALSFGQEGGDGDHGGQGSVAGLGGLRSSVSRGTAEETPDHRPYKGDNDHQQDQQSEGGGHANARYDSRIFCNGLVDGSLLMVRQGLWRR